MGTFGFDTSPASGFAPQRLKFFTHQILTALTKSSPIWGYPAVIAGDNYPFVNQRASQIPTIFLDIEAHEGGDNMIRVLGTLLTEAIRLHSEPDEEHALGVQLLTMNNGKSRYTLVLQAMQAKDPYDLIALLAQKRYQILNSAFEIIEHLYEDAPTNRPVVYQ